MCEQWRLHCTSQWVVDTVEWACVLCGRRIQNAWASRATNLHQILCYTWKLFRWFRRLQLRATGNWQLHHDNALTHTSRLVQFFGETSNHPYNSALLLPRLCSMQPLAFPQTKISFEREDISDYLWDSGKYKGVADSDRKNCVRSHGA